MKNIRIIRAAKNAGLVLRAVMVAGGALFLCACNTDKEIAGVPETPVDYRMRHPITVTEGDRSLQLFIGANRGSLTAAQRAEVMAFAQTWRREATGGVVIETPTGTTNERSSADAMREIQSILAASGVSRPAMMVRTYPASPRALAAVRIIYPKITAQAGPCGTWPKDIGPSMNRDYFENQPAWNFGCANQRNFAAMVENPQDLVQPRTNETAAYTMRRTTVMEKYRAGQSTATTYTGTDTSKISDVGK
jgi:pilus assembly protein CpaD